MKLSEEFQTWFGLFNEWTPKIAQLEDDKEELRIECNRLYGIGQELCTENDELKRENEGLRDGISFIIADSLGDDTSVDWIRIQLNLLLTAEEQDASPS